MTTNQKNKSENEIVSDVIQLAMKIHSRFGPALLESAYRECLAYELRKAGYHVQVERAMPIVYEEVRLDHGYRLDLLINNLVVIELKTVDAIIDVHFAQVMTYLKIGEYKLGLIINFKTAHLRNGLRRVVNGL